MSNPTFTVCLGYDDHESIYILPKDKFAEFKQFVTSTAKEDPDGSPELAVADWVQANGERLTEDPDFFLDLTDNGNAYEYLEEVIEEYKG